MNIVIASTYIPFIKGGGTMIVDSLERALIQAGHKVDTVKIPFTSDWMTMKEQLFAIRSLDLTEAAGNPIHLLITLRYPAYALRHPNKVSWFLHHHRQAYDLWGTEYQGIPDTPAGIQFRDELRETDTNYLKECKKIYAISPRIAGHLMSFNGIKADGVLYPPHPNSEMLHCGDYGDYFVYPCRLNPIKRQILAIEAMKHTKGDFRLLLVGAPDVDSYGYELKKEISQNGLEDRVVMTGWVSEQEKAKLIAQSCGVLYLPFNEDTCGYVSLEAFHSHKPLITLNDSGPLAELLQHGVNGMIAAPHPKSLAAAMEFLHANKNMARIMGGNARSILARYNISWQAVIEGLLA